ncbi:hypothetical protein EJ02DRAFT_421887 [Clathrospora elynae]|uniref:Rad60/SUMO-like domain-containing protein n=1 Tax=Clathrospora elynae TaxID=706981 RepID=A0A6A5SSB7_9PLEO|nr:hypothetical protein EJ02DRAFT_421887 [Clathrospora elynae]
MTDTNASAPAPKRRIFKRAQWQDAPKQEGHDMFSHSNEFKDVVAEENRRRDEDRRKEEAARQRKQSEPRERKRRRVSNDDEAKPAKCGSSSKARTSSTSSKARSKTPLSPAPAHPPPDSLTARYDTLAKAALLPRNERITITLDDEDDDGDEEDSGYISRSLNANSDRGDKPWKADGRQAQNLVVRSARHSPVDDDDEIEEVLDPMLVALREKVREKVRAQAAERAQAAVASTPDDEPVKAPVAQLYIDSEIPDANPLLVKVRIDSTIEKPRQAWCGRQGYSSEMTRNLFFTWRGKRIYDSTTIKRLGIQVDKHGNVSVEGDSNIYDDENIPKIHVQAWTDELYDQHLKEEAAIAAAKKLAAEAPSEVEERTPTPEPVPVVAKVRLVLKAKGKQEVRLMVNPHSTFGHIAHAYKLKAKVDKSQPITLMFDGERLLPMDEVSSQDFEDMDVIEVLFK